MKQSWFLIILIYACANPIPPTGGPKDLDPPILINTIPENKSLNFSGSEITMEFDEYIKEENLLTQLMITPNLSGPYSYRINRTRIVLSFEQPFDSATTYTLNFREGIKDITEGNVPPNLKFVFSTGNFLDSASVHGIVRSLMTKEVLEDITVSLYNDPDTMTIFDGPPRYSTLSNEQGEFTIENIKNGSYFIYSLDDQNRNLKLESRSEGYGFLEQSLILNDSLPGLELFIFNLDTRPIVLQNSRPVGTNYELKFNKALAHYQLITDEQSIVSNLIDNHQTLRIYYNKSIVDSLGIGFITRDSLQQTLDSLVYVKFEESTRKPDKFSTNFNLKAGPVNKSWRASIKFNKPITLVNYDSMYFRFDSLFSIPINASMLSTNYSNDEYIVALDFDDILANDSVHSNWVDPFELIIAKGSFISIENDTSSVIKREYSFKDPKDFGIVGGTITTDFSSFNIQLVDKKFEIIDKILVNSAEIKSYEFRNIAPGIYSIRVFVDENNNGIWDPGNIKLKTLPENIFLFFHNNVTTQEINLRANWEQSGLDLVF